MNDKNLTILKHAGVFSRFARQLINVCIYLQVVSIALGH